MKNTVFGAIYLSLAASIWGGLYVVSKYILDYIPPITLVWLRYVIAFVVLFSLLKTFEHKNKEKVKLVKKDWLLFAWIGFIGYFVSIALQFLGTKLSDAHTGSLITSATPAFVVIFARFILKESLDLRKVISLLLASAGVVVVIGWKNTSGDYFWGSLILVGAAITWALLSVYVKVASSRHSSLTITTYAILFALIFTTPMMFWELKTSPLVLNNMYIVLGVLYIGVAGTAGAFFLWNKGLELMDAGIGSLFLFLQPLVGCLLGWLLLHEHLYFNFYIGGAMILLGVFIVTVRREAKAKMSFYKEERTV
jgi:drug/metabolite transporter (DMT)-like permease